MSADIRQDTGQAPDLRNSAELSAMVESLTTVSTELLESYDRLAERAERMEKELCIANAELAKKVAEVETILETLPVGVVVRDMDGNVTRVNPALARILGRSGEDLLDASSEDLIPTPTSDDSPVNVSGPDGERRVLISSSSQIVSDSGAMSGSIDVFDDRTEVATLTERVHQMDKMAALGNMAAGIAHEIRNPMNAVKGFSDLFLRNLEPGTKDHRWAELISEGVREVDAIITSLLSFSTPEQLNLEEVDAQGLLDGALAAALQRTPGNRDASDWTITSECRAGRLTCDHIKIRQALRNLISNALDIQPEGGAIHIACQEQGSEVQFTVSDAGPGIPAEIVGRLTDPFFTTRAEGTGLGLSLVHTIVRLHGGNLEVLPTPSPLGGAQFKIHVPKTPLR